MKHIDLRVFLEGAAALPRSTTLSHDSSLRTLLLHLKAGEELPEHQTRGAITVQCLQGEVVFSSGDEAVTLLAQSLIGLAAGVPHSVIARQDTLLLVTVWEPVIAAS